jgi:uncharacterized membrane protein YfcA
LEIIGYIGAVFIGLTLGLIGGGGSILTVPVLVYLFGLDPIISTAYSLFIVGLTALAGSLSYMKQKLVDYKAAIVFAIPAFIAVFITRKFILPWIPDQIFSVGEFEVSKSFFVMALFAVLMLASSVSMIRKNKSKELEGMQSFNYPLITIEGFVVGVLTGLVGAGGGFLIIPALVIFAKLPMKVAVGTSLLIIAAKSLIGFLGDISNFEIDWIFLSSISVITISGIILGSYLTKFISGAKLKPAFGWFVLAMGFYILLKEFSKGL